MYPYLSTKLKSLHRYENSIFEVLNTGVLEIFMRKIDCDCNFHMDHFRHSFNCENITIQIHKLSQKLPVLIAKHLYVIFSVKVD